ncbi:DUF1559 domain-containing protein [uncultured Gimesia sp.]|uniref:DUF1559 family PulG-like putative transporter n=1 Tax=uncultured Gimesia sp. TaxID=1678688 RepID=UPI00262E7698|nr:DUF1559 domain-containing protein [uncultured Gimesia sp.]
MYQLIATNLIVILAAIDVASADELLTVRTNPYHVNAGTVAKVNPNGTVNIIRLTNPRIDCRNDGIADSDITEGHYLAFFGTNIDFAFEAFQLPPKGTWVSRIEIISVDHENEATARFPAAAIKRLKGGQKIALFRPPGTTTAVLKTIPVADVEEPTERIQAISKLLTIGKALQYWRETFDGFPPVVIRGPDGKPWHSWRVLILPYLGHVDLFNRYHFDEPWNGPNNSKLLKEIPDVYRFSSDKRFSATATHFLSIVGGETAFNPQGLTNHDPEHWMIGDYKAGVHGMKVDDFADGTHNTLLIGTASPHKSVDWLKPVDVAFTPQLKGPGDTQSFGSSITFKQEQQGAFLWADGTVSTISTSILPKLFRSLFTVNGNEEPIDRDARPDTISEPMGSIGIDYSSTIEFVRHKETYMARIAFRH